MTLFHRTSLFLAVLTIAAPSSAREPGRAQRSLDVMSRHATLESRRSSDTLESSVRERARKLAESDLRLLEEQQARLSAAEQRARTVAAFTSAADGQEAASGYLARGEALSARMDAVRFALRAALSGSASGGTAEARALKSHRQAERLRHDAEIYLGLPNAITRLDRQGGPVTRRERRALAGAMRGLTATGDYDAARKALLSVVAKLH